MEKMKLLDAVASWRSLADLAGIHYYEQIYGLNPWNFGFLNQNPVPLTKVLVGEAKALLNALRLKKISIMDFSRDHIRAIETFLYSEAFNTRIRKKLHDCFSEQLKPFSYYA